MVDFQEGKISKRNKHKVLNCLNRFHMWGDLRLSINMYFESRKYTTILLLSLMKPTEQNLIKYRL